MTDITPKTDSKACAVIAARAADEKKATDILVQDVRELVSVTDYFVIATASNNRQVSAIIDNVEDKLREQAGVKPNHREGTNEGSWALLDYGSFVIHVFQPEARDYYRLEELWNEAPVLDLQEEAGIEAVYSARIADMLKGK